LELFFFLGSLTLILSDLRSSRSDSRQKLQMARENLASASNLAGVPIQDFYTVTTRSSSGTLSFYIPLDGQGKTQMENLFSKLKETEGWELRPYGALSVLCKNGVILEPVVQKCVECTNRTYHYAQYDKSTYGVC
jgi:hypothetical protein